MGRESVEDTVELVVAMVAEEVESEVLFKTLGTTVAVVAWRFEDILLLLDINK